MDNFRDEEVVINLKLLKLYRFYHMLKVDETKIFNCNVYRLILFFYAAIMTCMVVYGSIGLFIEMDDIISDGDLFIVVFFTINFFFCEWRMCTILSKSNHFYDLTNVSRFNFLMSKHCCKHLNVLYDFRERTIKITNYLFVFSMIIFMQWILFPILAITFEMSDFEDIRLTNVMNFRYPVSTHTYNQYFLLFYIMEIAIVALPVYLIIVMDTLVLSFCCVIISQQEVVSLAFRNIGHEENSQLEYYEDFKSVLSDQIQLNLKIKSYYSLMRDILLVQVAMSSTFFIIMAYVLIEVCYSKDSNQILTIIKLGSSVTFIGSEVFFYCYLFGSMNLKKESINFALYSCDWTKMDIKFKKLLLLTMRMNSANNLMMRASPNKVVDLQMFANVISIAYNVISVMLKTMGSNN